MINIILQPHNTVHISQNKVGCDFPLVIWSEFRMGQYSDDDHREHAPHFTFYHEVGILKNYFSGALYSMHDCVSDIWIVWTSRLGRCREKQETRFISEYKRLKPATRFHLFNSETKWTLRCLNFCKMTRFRDSENRRPSGPDKSKVTQASLKTITVHKTQFNGANKNISDQPDSNQWPRDNCLASTVSRSANWAIVGWLTAAKF